MGGLMTNWSRNNFCRIVLAAAPTNLASSHLYQWNRITGNTKVPITQNLKHHMVKLIGKKILSNAPGNASQVVVVGVAGLGNVPDDGLLEELGAAVEQAVRHTVGQ